MTENNLNLPNDSILLSTIKGLEDLDKYSIDKEGNVYSFKLKNEWRALAKRLDTKGYIQFSFIRDGKKKYARVHYLVAMVFIPRRIGTTEINHKNGIRTDNRVENLEWCTRSENIRHAYDSLNHKRQYGTLSPKAKLTEENVKDIKCLLLNKVSFRRIAAIYNVHHSIIDGIDKGKRWKHVTI